MDFKEPPRAPRNDARSTAVRGAFRGIHRLELFSYLVLHQVLRSVAGWNDKPEKQALVELQRRYECLLERDLEDAQKGHYPLKLLFEPTFPARPRRFLAMTQEVVRGLFRSRRQGRREIPPVAHKEFPAYFLRNFHWQTDGYLSARSAHMYDDLVEFLFLGTAASMRRRALAKFAELAGNLKGLAVLDVGSGTGAFLRQLAVAHPSHRYTGIDMSPFYTRYAEERLREFPNVVVLPGNAEHLPFGDASFDAVVSVYLFHELPPPVRRTVLRELKRVLKPGGILVIQDAAQLTESAELAFFLERFHRRFHEPFFESYLNDPLEDLVSQAGFEMPAVEPAFVAKTVWARRPL